jgi:8-oxo-dGTP pyrophosphatase MutT (NUDIX family)
MKLLTEIDEKSLDISEIENVLGTTYELRKSARGIILNDKNEISLQFVGKNNYYKLPGGGVEVGETIEEALRREIIEEVGCNIKIEKELGVIIEYRNQLNLLHISYGFIARVDGIIGSPSYEQGEIDDGFKPVWISLDEAIELINPNTPLKNYEGKFIVKRENIFLNEAKILL